mmetsp:Transcript_19620/g.38126  ORF Transcript_19620/g.38126 Transcript_19620/m.38126 type:complete len:117 (+) Transcript_19620:212-562(+)|eukprot:CAMPEP_0173388048 /NCGR_PEP_ID=MMETSP1356-20130122/10437_1 /TAXON_ID=77927 ORGANISM="Hemiselmis virescens, Strain PCC157" /NCGR_SAMPLE_ID=MMETSP1356 /ASSEMBLY_ACC=CAM_ASM_000847 /LENGTH=116 /DNA_ID=CAMNT_0014344847 /DNA_START=215 /DNA_END=565 /DNA_ORIENTATION=+
MAESIIGKLEQWFMDDNTGVEQFVEEFAKAHKDVFDLDAEEHKQEYMTIYLDFQKKFESKIEAFLAENNVSHEAFMEECHKHQSGSEAGFGIIDVLLATLEFDVFMQMMLDAKTRF